jgi:hypothetical protein
MNLEAGFEKQGSGDGAVYAAAHAYNHPPGIQGTMLCDHTCIIHDVAGKTCCDSPVEDAPGGCSLLRRDV